MAEAHAAGVPPHRFWDYTYRELAAAFSGAAKKKLREQQTSLWASYYVAAFSRTKRLPNIGDLLRKMEPMRVMSAKAIHRTLMGMARAMGAKVTYRKKGEG